MIKYFLKFLVFLFKATIAIGSNVIVIIAIGAFIAAVFDVFPVVGIILGAAVLSVVIYKIVIFVKDKKEEKLFREAEENRRKKLNKESEKHRNT